MLLFFYKNKTCLDKKPVITQHFDNILLFFQNNSNTYSNTKQQLKLTYQHQWY